LLSIFGEADPSTLAALGGVSLDWLEVTVPLLYRTVEVTSIQQLEQLFCRRDDAEVSSNLAHLLIPFPPFLSSASPLAR